MDGKTMSFAVEGDGPSALPPTATPWAGLRQAIRALPDSGIVEVFNYGREREGLVPLWVGEGDLPTEASICAAAYEALQEGRTFYTYQRGIPPLRAAVAEMLARVYEVPVGPEQIFVTGSGMQAIQLSLQAILDAGDEIVVAQPVWPNVLAAAAVLGATVVDVVMDFDPAGGWSLDLDALMAACGPRTRAIFVNSPANPTGWLMERAQMLRLRDFARARGLWIVADEVYGRLTYDRPHAPGFLEICEPEDRLIIVNTFSKNWAMTGWRMGWIVGPPSIGQVFENLIQYSTSGVPEFNQRAALAALAQGDAPIEAFRERCRQNRERACDAMLAIPGIRLVPPKGGMYLFFGLEGEEDSRALAFRLVDEANVGLAPGTAFGKGGEAYLRLCLAASPHVVEEGVSRLRAALR